MAITQIPQINLQDPDKYALVGGLFGIIDSAMDAIITINEAQRILLFNPAAELMFGCKATEVLGSRVDRFIPERFRNAHKEHIRNFGETGETSRRMGQLGEIRGLRTNGQEFPIEASISQVTIGSTKLFSVILRDITQRKQMETEIETSERKFRAVYEQAPLGIALIDSKTGHFLQVNQKYCEIAGRTQQEMLKLDFQTMTHPDDLQTDLNNMQLLREGKIPYFNMEKRYIRPDGSIIWVALTVVPMWEEGEPGSIHIAMIMDITERRKAEEATRESEEKFRLLAENARAIIGIVQGEKFAYVNPYLEQITGYTREELLQMPIAQIVHPDSRAQVLERAKRRQAGQEVESHYEFAILTKSGQKRLLDFSATRITYQGKPAIVGIAIDVTERKQTEEALAKSEQRYRTLFNSIDEGFCIIEVLFDASRRPVDYRFLEINPAFERQTGLHDAQGKLMRTLAPEHEAHWFETYGRIALTGKPERFVNEAKALNRWYDVYAFRVEKLEEHKVAILFNDITERKRAEVDLVSTKDQLENKNKELETIIGIVSHDLRAPLVNVKGFAHEIGKDCAIVQETLQKESCDAASKKLAPVFDNFDDSINFIISSAEAVDNLAKSLVDITRAGLGPIKPEQLDMNEIIAKVMASIQFKFKQHNVSYDVTADLPPCFGDSQQIIQIFTNLIDNAVKYLDPNRTGEICITGSIEAGHAMYSVSDNGIGISPENQGKIFEPYYQLHEKAAEGIGMGLATVKRMVDRNNGKIWVYSEKDKGSTFYVALPITPLTRATI